MKLNMRKKLTAKIKPFNKITELCTSEAMLKSSIYCNFLFHTLPEHWKLWNEICILF